MESQKKLPLLLFLIVIKAINPSIPLVLLSSVLQFIGQSERYIGKRGEFDNSVSSHNTKCYKTCYADFYVTITVMYNNNLQSMIVAKWVISTFFSLFCQNNDRFTFWPIAVSLPCLAHVWLVPKDSFGSSCRHKGELPGWKLPLGGGHLAGSTHILVTVLRCACHATLAIRLIVASMLRG